MSDERPGSQPEDAELQRLLRGLGAGSGEQLEPVTGSPHTPADELSREARMAAHIDQQVAELTAQRRSSRYLGFIALAAVVALSLGGMRYLGWNSGHLTIEQEPLAGGKPPEQVPAPSVTPPEPAVAPPQVVAPSPRAPTLAETGPRPSASTGSPEVGSTLAQENQLFREAADASRSGDVPLALSRLDQLLARYPSSPLAQGALVRKFRLLASAGRTDEARREAERYLAAYPTGFAVAEAEATKQGGGASQPPAAPGESEIP